jgi:NMD protein affecting ribosome stability and mRNA decay
MRQCKSCLRIHFEDDPKNTLQYLEVLAYAEPIICADCRRFGITEAVVQVAASVGIPSHPAQVEKGVSGGTILSAV